MRKLGKREAIGVFAGLGLITYLFFAGPLMALFNTAPEVADTGVPSSGFVTEEIVVGLGEVARAGDTLTVHYVGRLSDGKVFDSSLDTNTPYTLVLGRGTVIRGWDEGLVGMREGGKRLLIIAPDYGYGARGIGAIPPNSTLIFEVELLNVDKSAAPFAQ